MSSIEIKPSIKVGISEILHGISSLETSELEEFLKEVGHILAKRKSNSLSEQETELLLCINQPLLSELEQKEYDTLYFQLQDETISAENHEKLIGLINKREKKGAERLAALIQLSQLQKITPKDLMKQMGLSSLADA